jgi:hypothetical protein
MINIDKEIAKKGQVKLILLPNEEYQSYLIGVSRALASKYKKISYVCLNKSAEAILSGFEENNINKNRFCFIDCIAKQSHSKVKDFEGCTFIDSPQALTQLGLATSTELKKVNCLIFDSLSTMLVYDKGNNVVRFTHAIINKVRETKTHLIFTLIESDKDSALVQDIEMFVDQIIHFK